MFGEKYSIMCLYIGRNHTFQKQSQVFERLNKIYLGISYGLLTVFVITTNLMLIYGFYKTSRPFTIITKLFIYLSIWQLIITLIVVPNIIYMVLNMVITRIHFIIFMTFTFLALSVDLLTVWTVSFLRFLTIFKPMYRAKTRTVYKLLIMEFLLSFLAALSIFLGNVFLVSSVDEVRTINYKILSVVYFVMILLTSFINLSSLTILRRSTNLKAQQKGDSVLANQMAINRKKMALYTLLLITIVQFVFTLPATCLNLFEFNFLYNDYFILIYISSHCLQFLNIGVVSLIIVWRTNKLREFYGEKFFCFKND